MAKDKENEKKDEQWEKWEAFLAVAEEQRKKDGTHHIFLEQKERGEFNTIPDSFKVQHSIRVAPK